MHFWAPYVAWSCIFLILADSWQNMNCLLCSHNGVKPQLNVKLWVQDLRIKEQELLCRPTLLQKNHTERNPLSRRQRYQLSDWQQPQ